MREVDVPTHLLTLRILVANEDDGGQLTVTNHLLTISQRLEEWIVRTILTTGRAENLGNFVSRLILQLLDLTLASFELLTESMDKKGNGRKDGQHDRAT